MKLKLWIALLALSVVVAACRNLLTEDPKSFVTSDSFFKTEADLKSGVMAAYSPMRSNNLFNGWPWLSLELASDQVRIDRDEPTGLPLLLDREPRGHRRMARALQHGFPRQPGSGECRPRAAVDQPGVEAHLSRRGQVPARLRLPLADQAVRRRPAPPDPGGS